MADLVTHEALGELEVVHLFLGAMPTGVSVSHTGRVFVCFPKWSDDVRFTVGEVRDGEVVALLDAERNDPAATPTPSGPVGVRGRGRWSSVAIEGRLGVGSPPLNGPPDGRRLRVMTSVLCRLGLHRWRHLRTPEGEPYRRCSRCGKDGDDEGLRAALRAGWWT